MVSTSSSPPRSGVWYFSQGWKLVSLPGIRRFVILPLLINIILMGGAFWWLFTKLESWIPSLMSYVPDWLQWLNYLLWPVAVISVLLVFGYFFSTIANWIAAPFNGLLAEQLEARLTGATPPDTGILGIMKAPGCWPSNTATIRSITTRCRLKRCAPPCAARRSPICSLAR